MHAGPRRRHRRRRRRRRIRPGRASATRQEPPTLQRPHCPEEEIKWSRLPMVRRCRAHRPQPLLTISRWPYSCENFSSYDRAHLVLRSLHEYDLEYLQALLDDNSLKIAAFEELALSNGYGPLAPCFNSASNRTQAEFCRKSSSSKTSLASTDSSSALIRGVASPR